MQMYKTNTKTLRTKLYGQKQRNVPYCYPNDKKKNKLFNTDIVNQKSFCIQDTPIRFSPTVFNG